MSSHDATPAVMDRVADMIRDRLPEPQATLVEAFVRQYYARVAPEDLAHLDAVDVYGAALSHWSLAQKPPAGDARVRVYNPRFDEHGWQTTHTVVEVHVEDMPFLVDSVGMELVRHGLDIHVVIHPVIRLRRDDDGDVVDVLEPSTERHVDGDDTDVSAESFIHVEVDRQGDPEILAQIERDLTSVLSDVRAAVEDWPTMLHAIDNVTTQLDENPPPVPPQELDEVKALLAWLADNHFTFLGFREYELVSEDGEDQLRAVPDTGLGILRGAASRSASFAKVPPEVRQLARQKNLLNITKANSMATVHRPTRLDYVGVKRFDDTGEPVGEWRFLGLYTSTLYSISVTQIPVLRRKVDTVLDRAGFEPASHDAKDLLTILEQYPRDELLQIDEDELYDTAMGILGLQERQRLRVFIRRERFGRYFSCLVFLPRDRLNTDNRVAIQRILLDALGGVSIEYQSRLSESVLARIHLIVRIEPGSHVDYDAAAIERRLAQATRSWTDDLSDALVDEFGEHRGVELFHRYRDAFPTAYRADFPARMGAVDVRRIEDAFDHDLAMHAHRPLEAPPDFLRLKLFHTGQPITISDVLPVFENLGVKVVDERPYEIRPEGAEPVWIYDFGLSTAQVSTEPLDEALRELAQEAFARVWRGETENDGFNRLVLAAGLPWRDATVLRAYSKYLRQTGQTFSQDYMERTLAAHPHIARLLVELFRTRFDPVEPPAGRATAADELTRQLLGAIDAVASLDEDRILRSFLGLVAATVRTNAFQIDDEGRPKSHLALKFDSSLIDDLPSPRPLYEIFVYSPRTEGVHLRGGKVARGGLRWSDRREDFRREVLGLMQAQMVKNAVIVPTGAKGGFVVKRPPADRAALADEVVASYRTFVRGLLDLTDNLVGGTVVPPPDVVRHDGDDPYLVVAADKGTAAFSDIANEISAEYGFWLGDAFASGGSTGYDHKRMGITARGAFESVKRHFRQLGINAETTEITAVGIGDMSGDVFGNGMLLFPHLKLVGAFDHRHIFLDPDPDPEAAARERERLFRLPGSTWGNYDQAVLSPGGGVYPRSAKVIPLSPEARERLAIEDETATPHEVIRALLQAPVDLLWNGAIGTFVKASSESHTQVGDKANDAVRVDARDLRCRVVAEGGNLGFTQAARIEFARTGGMVNTDFIDNSGGVDCSDREVNIKILLDGEVAAGDLTRKQRDELLAEMTDEVADLVLQDNYLQAQALARTVASTRQRGPRHLGFLRSAEQAGRVDLRREAGADASDERSPGGERLTTPELAVLFAHTKIMLYDALLASDVPDDPYMAGELGRYFPTPVRERFAASLQAHPLRRELVANTVANEVVNRLDFTATFTVADHMDAALAEIARAFTVVCQIMGLRRLWAGVEALDDRVPLAVQTEMVADIGRVLTSLMRWLLRHRQPPIDVAAEVTRFADQVTALAPALRDLMAPKDRDRCEGRAAQFLGEGVPAGLAEDVAWLGAVMPAPDLVEVAAEAGEPAETVAAVHAALCERLRLEWLREQMDALAFATRWETLSRLGLRDELFDHRRALTAAVLRSAAPDETPAARVDAWLAANPVAAARFQRLIAEVDRSGTCDMTTLTVALSELRNLVRTDRLD